MLRRKNKWMQRKIAPRIGQVPDSHRACRHVHMLRMPSNCMVKGEHLTAPTGEPEAQKAAKNSFKNGQNSPKKGPKTA